MPEIKQNEGVNETPRQNQKGLPEKVLRNKAIIALYLVGFSQRQIEKIVKVSRRNVRLFIVKYFPRYSQELIDNFIKKSQKIKK